jgi:site-specific recombinase XerD
MILYPTVDEIRRGFAHVAKCVYLVRDDTGSVLYIGQTANVCSRIQQHLRPSCNEKFALALKAALPAGLQWRVELWTADEFNDDPSGLEALLIKTHRPVYNLKTESHALIPSPTSLGYTPSPEEEIEDVRPTTTVDDVIRLVTNAVTSPHTRRAYSRALGDFIAWHQRVGATGISKATVQAHVAELRATGVTASSINQRLTAIRKFAQEAADNGLIDEVTAQAIRRVEGVRSEGKRLGNWLNQKEAQALINAPDITTPKGLRDRAILAVLLGCGLRREEAAGLRTSHIQQREGRWVIVDLVGKRNKTRSVPMPAWAKAAVDAWCSKASIIHGPIFLSIRRGGHVQQHAMTAQAIRDVVTGYAKQVGVTVAPHDLRRTFAKLAYKGGSPVDQIQLSLGHSSMQTTERYLGVQQDLSSAPCDVLGLRL